MSDRWICDIEHEIWKESTYHGEDYRATIGSLKEALENLPDDAPIGVRFDGGYGYTDINELLLADSGLFILNCD